MVEPTPLPVVRILRMTPMDEAYGYARRLAVALWEKHWKADAPNWKPMDDLPGVLTQIDNMTAELVRASIKHGAKNDPERGG